MSRGWTIEESKEELSRLDDRLKDLIESIIEDMDKLSQTQVDRAYQRNVLHGLQEESPNE